MRQTEISYITVKSIEENKIATNIEIYKEKMWTVTADISRDGINFYISKENICYNQPVIIDINKNNELVFKCMDKNIVIPYAIQTKLTRTLRNYLIIRGY